jgi:hypothetical protein
MRHQRLDQKERRFQIGLQQKIEVVLGNILDGRALSDAGVVDENVECRAAIALGQFGT